MLIDLKQYKKTGIISADPVVSLELRIKDKAFRPGTVRVHLPAPINASQLFEGQLLSTEPFFRMASVEDYPQRSVFYNEELTQNTTFSVKYAFHIEAEYRELDARKVEDTPQPAFTDEQIERFIANESCDCGSYTGELFERVLISDVAPAKQIEFTSEREAKLEQLKKNATGRLALIRAIYDHCRRADIVEKNVEMVTLLRMAGVPARWQGGIDLRNCSKTAPVKSSDWCLYYAAPYGWCFSDAKAVPGEIQRVSGQDAKQESSMNDADSKEMADFYFCNIDPYRMPTASKYAASLYPAKDYLRADELTNYRGEVECGEHGLRADEFDTLITCEQV